ncbi:Anoctamin-4 [Bulinus truncatus]|nr:Anoctamin-4 [Bulinus truncatus]
MEDSYEGIPLSPAGIAPIGFEMQMMEGGVTPSNHHMEAEAPLPPPPPPLAPIGFEAQVPAPAAATITTPTSSLIRGSLNRGSQKDQAGIAGKEDSREHVSALSFKPLHNQETDLDLPPPPPPPEAVQVTIQQESENDKKSLQEDENESLFMDDGKRRVDYVLVYVVDTDEEDENQKRIWREQFQKSLEKEGLELEVTAMKSKVKPVVPINKLLKCCRSSQRGRDKKTYYVKVHAPWEVLTKYAELTNMKMPLAKNDMIEKFETCWSKCPTPFDIDKDILPEIPDYFTAPFSRRRIQQFIIKDKDTFFSPAQRSLMTYQVLLRAVFEDVGDPAKNKFGIKNMLSNNSYLAAFPLHEGEYTSEHSLLTEGPRNQRHLLYETWAKPGAWYKFQPLDHIRLYFGEKIAIYFAWLGYYTGLLIPAGLVGLAIFIYGLARMPFHQASNEICSDNAPGNYTMCPLCDKQCDYWQLKSSCIYSRVTYVFDNEATVAFAAFMALWSTVFHEMWKRKAAEIEYDWDVADFEQEETIRPEYEASVRRRRINPVTKAEEPYLSFTSKLCRFTSSLWVVLFMLCIVVAAVFGVIVYRLTVRAILYENDISKQRVGIVTSVSASIINLIIIILLGKVYQFIAQMLTNFETHRTLTEWEDSFTLKMFLFQFVNHFASLFYIAFFKGKLVGRPGLYSRQINNSRQEECDPSGCFIELCIQLGIIMVGKQTFNNSKEVVLPKLLNWIKSRKINKAEEKNHEKVSQWEKDYAMDSMPDLGLFDEYLEMVIQYGFVTIFVAAFPVAPLFALLNNIIEIRLDAYKFVTQWRRPLGMRAQDIGVWFGILQGISKVAVMSNAVIIAFTSEFVPKLVYQYSYNDNNDLKGYINFSLSVFNVSHFENDSIPLKKDKLYENITECRYRDYRASSEPYNYTLHYWHILTARLAFILVFVICIWILSWTISYMVPDIPRAVKLQMLREKYLARESALEFDLHRNKSNDNTDGKKSDHHSDQHSTFSISVKSEKCPFSLILKKFLSNSTLTF